MSSLRPSRQKKILEGHLAATRAREAAAAAEALTPLGDNAHFAVPVVIPTLRPTLVRFVAVLGLALLNYAVLLALLPLLGPGRTH